MTYEQYWTVYLKAAMACDTFGPIVREHLADFKAATKNAWDAGHTAARTEAEAEWRHKAETQDGRAEYWKSKSKILEAEITKLREALVCYADAP